MSMLLSSLYFQGAVGTHFLKEVERDIFSGMSAFASLGVCVIGGAYLGANTGELLVRRYSSNVGDEDICKKIGIVFSRGLGGGLGLCAGFLIATSLTADALEV